MSVSLFVRHVWRGDGGAGGEVGQDGGGNGEGRLNFYTFEGEA